MVFLSGCGTLGTSATDLALAGAGGAIGYEVSDHNVSGAAIGAAGGYVISKVAQTQVKKAVTDAEKRGYDRAMNQAVKQQYWIIQNLQKQDDETGAEARPVTVTLPETTTNDGTILRPTTAVIRAQ
ncbi:hypothetical protein CKA38_10575 [Ereboglobus luteus]|uniref:Glycine zipper domain-containing protein n=2 Tax=Opitutaceae TaxID=134623 RepID=A0A2U8E464_9BACT|nr:hypothetical protein CKA38_10575 [Ereboglobus luteus]